MSELTDEPATTEVDVAANEPATTEVDIPATGEVDIHPEDPDDEWPTDRARSGLRLAAPTALLLALVVLAGGFWGGAVAERHHAGSSSGSSALSALASRFAAARGATGSTGGAGAGGTGFGGAAGFGGAGTSAAAGIVTGVQGDILYVTDSTNGNLIKVVVGPSVQRHPDRQVQPGRLADRRHRGGSGDKGGQRQRDRHLRPGHRPGPHDRRLDGAGLAGRG